MSEPTSVSDVRVPLFGCRTSRVYVVAVGGDFSDGESTQVGSFLHVAVLYTCSTLVRVAVLRTQLSLYAVHAHDHFI
jgi:hypothetical protein